MGVCFCHATAPFNSVLYGLVEKNATKFNVTDWPIGTILTVTVCLRSCDLQSEAFMSELRVISRTLSIVK